MGFFNNAFFNWLFRRNKPKKLKLGLALGSGGAKGFAHLGALKAFEENGIEFDIQNQTKNHQKNTKKRKNQ